MRYLIIYREDKKAKESFWKAVANPTILSALLDDFKTFIDLKCVKSEQCKYWQNALKMIGMVKCLIRADRDGDFLLHVSTVGNLLILLVGFDRLHYLRCGSFYYKTLKSLKTTHPYLYQRFLLGDFVAKTNSGSFNAVACDMKLEQSINRSAKSSHGIIGQTKYHQYITEWQLIYHEVLDISNAYRQVLQSDTTKGETYLHKDLSNFRIKQKNQSVTALKTFVRSHGNPFLEKSKLKNFVTQVKSHPDISAKLLNIFENSACKEKSFRKSVFTDRSKLLHDRIPKMSLPQVNDELSTSTLEKKKLSQKEISAQTEVAMKKISIAKSKCGSLEQVAKYDFSNSYLFLGDDMFPIDSILYILQEDLL